jgi:hypothetical protein
MVTLRIWLVTGTVIPGALLNPLLSASCGKLVRKLLPALVQFVPSAE